MKRAIEEKLKSKQPKKRAKVDVSARINDSTFMGTEVTSFCYKLGDITCSMGDVSNNYFVGDVVTVMKELDNGVYFEKFEPHQDSLPDNSDKLNCRCILNVPKNLLVTESILETDKVQWSALDVDDETKVFKYPKETNDFVEKHYFAFSNEGGAEQVTGPSGYTYDFKQMRQYKGEAERVLKRDQIAPPTQIRNKISFPKDSFPVYPDYFEEKIECISIESLDEDNEKYRVKVDLYLHIDNFWEYEVSTEFEKKAQDVMGLDSLFEELLCKPAKEGVVQVKNFLEEDSRYTMNRYIDGLSLQEPRLFHPGSNKQVLDILHPSLYCYVHGTSQPSWEGVDAVNKMYESAVKAPNKKWNLKKKEVSKYAWLPSDCKVSAGGIVEFQSPIATHPYDYFTKYQLENLLESALPHLANVLHYAREFEFMGDDWIDSPKKKKKNPLNNLEGTTLQVIPKIVDYVLQPGESYEGVWHMEGMSHEHIMATVIYVSSRDPNIEGGTLKFKRAFSNPEGSYFRNMSYAQNSGYRRPVNKFFEAGLTPIGSLETPENSLLVFPNTHVHKLSKMTNTGKSVAKRRIVVLFIIDPRVNVISTKYIPNQNASYARIPVDRQLQAWGLSLEEFDKPWSTIKAFCGLFSLEEAQTYQKELMHERKYYKNTWNVREVGLCEH